MPLRVLWHVGSNFSISITFDIGYERLLIKYMLKEYSRFRFSHLLSNTSSFFLSSFNFRIFFDSSSSPHLASIGSLTWIILRLLCLLRASRSLVVYANKYYSAVLSRMMSDVCPFLAGVGH